MTHKRGGRWQAVLDHPIIRLELRRVRRKRWWPGRRFFLFYPALLGAALGYGVVLVLSDSLNVQLATLATAVPLVCLLSVVTWLLSLALLWVAPVLTAMSIARERELGTLDLLRATLLSERSIVLGKLGACLVRLWPAMLTLALLAPFRLIGGTGAGLFGPFYFPALMMDPVSDLEQAWVWLLLASVTGLFRPWGDLALHAAVGLFVSALSRSSGVAIAVSYGAIIALRVMLSLATSLLSAALVTMPDFTQDILEIDKMVIMPSLISLGMVLVEFAGAALLVRAAVRWLERA